MTEYLYYFVFMCINMRKTYPSLKRYQLNAFVINVKYCSYNI